MVHFITRVPMVLVANHRFETNATIASQVVAAYAKPGSSRQLVIGHFQSQSKNEAFFQKPAPKTKTILSSFPPSERCR